MKAAYIEETGPVDNIHYGDLPEPRPGEREVLVDVEAVSVNPVDTYLRSGAIPMDLPMPYILGCDLSGTVVETGAGASRFKPGDRVWGSNQGLLGRQGTFAERACVNEDWLYPTPEGVSSQDAAAAALVGITAHLGLVSRGRFQEGEALFVNGGSGGVGSMVIQMGRNLGARQIIATAGSEEKLARCRQLGATDVIHYQEQDVLAELRRVAPEGVGLWWDTTREPDLERALEGLARDGRIVVMAGREAVGRVPIGPFYVKGASLLGFVMFMESPETQRQCAEDINDWLAEGRLRAPIDRVLPLSQSAEAHRLQEDSTVGLSGVLAGKIVLTPEEAAS